MKSAAIVVAFLASAVLAQSDGVLGAPVLYTVQGAPVVCMSVGREEGAAQWSSMCAPIGRWMQCAETATTLTCDTGAPRRPARFD